VTQSKRGRHLAPVFISAALSAPDSNRGWLAQIGRDGGEQTARSAAPAQGKHVSLIPLLRREERRSRDHRRGGTRRPVANPGRIGHIGHLKTGGGPSQSLRDVRGMRGASPRAVSRAPPGRVRPRGRCQPVLRLLRPAAQPAPRAMRPRVRRAAAGRPAPARRWRLPAQPLRPARPGARVHHAERVTPERVGAARQPGLGRAPAAAGGARFLTVHPGTSAR